MPSKTPNSQLSLVLAGFVNRPVGQPSQFRHKIIDHLHLSHLVTRQPAQPHLPDQIRCQIQQFEILARMCMKRADI